jgi:hypothetical protein
MLITNLRDAVTLALPELAGIAAGAQPSVAITIRRSPVRMAITSRRKDYLPSF